MSKGRPKKRKGIFQTELASEICKREYSPRREVNISDVSRVLRHLFEILSEKEYGDVAYFLDKRMKYYRQKAKKMRKKVLS